MSQPISAMIPAAASAPTPGMVGQSPSGLLKGIKAVVERGIERAEGTADGVDLVEVDLQQLPLMSGEPATQGLDHLLTRRADASLDPIGEARPPCSPW